MKNAKPLLSDARPVALITLAVFAWSVVPLLVSLSGAAGAPFAFTVAWRVGTIAGCFALMALFCGRMTVSGRAWRVVWRGVPRLPMAIWVGSYFEITLYAAATRFISVSTVAALYEVWPVTAVVFTFLLFKREVRCRKIRFVDIILFLVAFLGAVFVIASDSAGGFAGFVSAGTG